MPVNDIGLSGNHFPNHSFGLHLTKNCLCLESTRSSAFFALVKLWWSNLKSCTANAIPVVKALPPTNRFSVKRKNRFLCQRSKPDQAEVNKWKNRFILRKATPVESSSPQRLRWEKEQEKNHTAELKQDAYVPFRRGVMKCPPQAGFVPIYNALGEDLGHQQLEGRSHHSRQECRTGLCGDSSSLEILWEGVQGLKREKWSFPDQTVGDFKLNTNLILLFMAW